MTDHGATRPEIAVAVASHDRPIRLRWLLNGLEEQTLARDRFEVIVVHDSSGPETEALLREHPLAALGVLRHVQLAPGTGGKGVSRNIAWREARAPLIAFTDDDCRPEPHWLERALAAAERHPGAIVQGRTEPDPEEERLKAAPYRHTQSIKPPVSAAQTCNIVYPRELLERLGGLDESLSWGEDMDLAMRGRKAGADFVGAPEVLTWHAVVPISYLEALRATFRWQDLPAVVKRHPELRRDFPLWAFYHRRHAWLPLAVAALVLERRNPLWATLALPYVVHTLPTHGTDPRGRIRNFLELPGRFIEDATGLAVLARASVKHRSLFL